jgi:hypothetical protein
MHQLFMIQRFDNYIFGVLLLSQLLSSGKHTVDCIHWQVGNNGNPMIDDHKSLQDGRRSKLFGLRLNSITALSLPD